MTMFKKAVKSFQWGNHQVTMETGEIARQSGGAVIVNVDDTVVMGTVCLLYTSPSPRDRQKSRMPSSA